MILIRITNQTPNGFSPVLLVERGNGHFLYMEGAHHVVIAPSAKSMHIQMSFNQCCRTTSLIHLFDPLFTPNHRLYLRMAYIVYNFVIGFVAIIFIVCEYIL